MISYAPWLIEVGAHCRSSDPYPPQWTRTESLHRIFPLGVAIPQRPRLRDGHLRRTQTMLLPPNHRNLVHWKQRPPSPSSSSLDVGVLFFNSLVGRLVSILSVQVMGPSSTSQSAVMNAYFSFGTGHSPSPASYTSLSPPAPRPPGAILSRECPLHRMHRGLLSQPS